jgi:hypothetical protein
MPNNDPAEWLTMEYLESGGFFDMPLAVRPLPPTAPRPPPQTNI